jgi:hypothetical protein
VDSLSDLEKLLGMMAGYQVLLRCRPEVAHFGLNLGANFGGVAAARVKIDKSTGRLPGRCVREIQEFD